MDRMMPFIKRGACGVCLPSRTLPSWLPASFSLGIFSFSLNPPSLPLPVFFLDATLIVASSSVQVTRISRVVGFATRPRWLTFSILSHGDCLGLPPLRSTSAYPSFRQRRVLNIDRQGRVLSELRHPTDAWFDGVFEGSSAWTTSAAFGNGYA